MMLDKSGFLSLEQVQGQYLNKPQKANLNVAKEGSMSFREALDKASGNQKVHFSKHAANRLETRNIELTTGQMQRLQDAADRASQKGIKDSLVLMDELAFIMNVPSQTVVTAMDATSTAENIFTNIDGAVIA